MSGSGARHASAAAVFLVLAAALAVVGVVSAMVGQFPIPAREVLGGLLRGIGLADGPAPDPLADATLWNIRFPRILLGLLVGAALGCSGTVMQAVFGNPLAEPGVIGISAGAAVGACVAIVVDVAFAGIYTVPLLAFLGALATTLLVYGLSRSRGRAGVVTMILTGIAVTAVANALIALLVFMADSTGRDQIVFWQMGSLNGATWTAVRTSAPVVLLGLAGCLLVSGRLNLLALGERAAQHSGVHVERLRMVSIACTALLTGAAVAYAGIIAFVGLIVPHVLRLVMGPSNRALVPASALGGALLISGADLAARTLVAYADLPIGIFTALVGGPMFFLLLRRTIRKGAAL